jgi:hypothetical protein
MMLGYVDSAIERVRTVVSAESEFAKNNPSVGYACTLSQLPDDDGTPRRVKTGEDNGYVFKISRCEQPISGTPKLKYWITARPLRTGLPAFCSDQSAMLRAHCGFRATPSLAALSWNFSPAKESLLVNFFGNKKRTTIVAKVLEFAGFWVGVARTPARNSGVPRKKGFKDSPPYDTPV